MLLQSPKCNDAYLFSPRIGRSSSVLGNRPRYQGAGKPLDQPSPTLYPMVLVQYCAITALAKFPALTSAALPGLGSEQISAKIVQEVYSIGVGKLTNGTCLQCTASVDVLHIATLTLFQDIIT